ncbi:retrovirus-related pol polyprotein from transposon TNT 1-94 [Tanacetum coccineum]
MSIPSLRPCMCASAALLVCFSGGDVYRRKIVVMFGIGGLSFNTNLSQVAKPQFAKVEVPLLDLNFRVVKFKKYSDSDEEDDEKAKDETCLVAQASNEICLGVDLEPNEWIKDSGCSKHMTGQICDNKCRVTFREHDSEITKDGKVIGRAHASHKAKNIVSMTRCLELLHLDLFDPSAVRSYGGNRYTLVLVDDYSRLIEESLNVTFDETPPPSKTSPLVDDDLDEEEAIKVTEKKILENDIEDETLDIDEVVNIKESRNHPLENVLGNLNQRTLRLVAQGYNQQEGIDCDETYAPVARHESIRILLAYDCALDFKLFQMDVKSAFLNGFINEEVYVAQLSGFIDFEKPDHVYKLKKALYGLKQAPKAWYGRLKAFLIKHEYKMGMVDNILFTKKKSSNLIIVQIYVDDIIFGSTCQDMCDEFSKIMHDEFEMSMMGELNFFLGLQIKQMEDGIFFNQSKYIKEMLKKFGLKDSKPMKTPMSSDTKLTKDEECESVDSTKYRGMIDKWSLDDLGYSVPTDGPYQTNPLCPDDIKNYIQEEREGPVTRIHHWAEIPVEENKILTREIMSTMKPWVEIIRENVFCLGGNWDHVPACLCYMLYFVAKSKKFNLAFFIAKRMEFVTKQARLILPYGMLLTRLFKYAMSENAELFNESYVLYDRVMYPLTTQQERKTRKNYGMKRGRHSTSSSSAFDQPSDDIK